MVTRYGTAALFYYISTVHSVLLAFTLYRITRRPIAADQERRGFVGLIRTSTALFALDPRGRRKGRNP